VHPPGDGDAPVAAAASAQEALQALGASDGDAPGAGQMPAGPWALGAGPATAAEPGWLAP